MKKRDILNSIKNTIYNNEFISVDDEKLSALVGQLSKQALSLPYYEVSEKLLSKEEIIQYFFIANSINFKFWDDETKENYKINDYYDSQAMFYTLNNNLWLLDVNELAALNERKAKEVFGNIPMLQERIDILHENAEILKNKYNNKAINILEAGNFEIPKILDEMTNILSWKDIYKNHIFMKRAQLFLVMVAGCLQKYNLLKGIEELTLFPDYQLPRALEYLKVLKYSDGLSNKINNREMIDCGSNEELALRSFTIYVGELIGDKLKCPSVYLDYMLWKMGRNIEKEHHYTKCIWY